MPVSSPPRTGPAPVTGDTVALDGSPGLYRVRLVANGLVEVEHLVTGHPAGTWPLRATTVVLPNPPINERNVDVHA